MTYIDPINLEKNTSEVDLGLRWLNLSGTMSKIQIFERKKNLGENVREPDQKENKLDENSSRNLRYYHKIGKFYIVMQMTETRLRCSIIKLCYNS